METPITSHITDEQYAGLLAGETSSAIQAHLAECAECAGEAERLSRAVASFNVASSLWAERRAATHPLLTLKSQPAEHRFRTAQRWAAAACAVAVTLALGSAVRSRQHSPAPTQVAVTSPAAAPVSATTLKSDNALLSAIDGEVSAQESTPAASVYSIGNAAHTERGHSARKAVNE